VPLLTNGLLKHSREYMSKVLRIIERTYDNSPRYLYHYSRNPDLHTSGIDAKSGAFGREYKRSFFTTDPNSDRIKRHITGSSHLYKIDTEHPNLKNHVFKREETMKQMGIHKDEFVTNKHIPPGDHIEKVK
jgi:hypothetical protein